MLQNRDKNQYTERSILVQLTEGKIEMPEGSLPPQNNVSVALAAAGGGFVGAAVAILAVNAMTGSDPDTASLQDMDNKQPVAVAELQPASD